MPSLYKGVAVEAAGKVSIPVADIKVSQLQSNATGEDFERALEVMAKALFEEKWKSVQTELAIERGHMLAEIATERERVKAEAQQAGFREGLTKAQAEANKLMMQVQQAYKELEEDRLRFIEESRQQITELVVVIAEQFMQEQLQRVPEFLINMVSRAIQELVSRRKVCVFVHPSRVETVISYSYLLPGTADGDEILIRPDPSLEVDAFRVEDESGAVAVSLSEHLKNMRQVLSDA